MTTAIIAATTLSVIAGAHLYWAAGGQAGSSAAIPQANGEPLFRPGRGATVLVATGLFALAGLALWRDGLILLPLPFFIAKIGAWLATLVFLVRAIGDFKYLGWSKRVRGSRFARLDDVVYAPLCLMLAICFAVLSIA